MKPARAERYRREHAAAIARLRVAAGRPPPPRRTRIGVAVAYVVTVLLIPVPRALSSSWWAMGLQLVLIAALAGLYVVLRRVTRLITEAPDDALDDLLVGLRNDYFRDAYRVLGAAVLLLALALLVLAEQIDLAAVMDAGAYWPVFGLVLGIPLVVAAVRLPDLDAQP
jgi:hypothetical protein